MLDVFGLGVIPKNDQYKEIKTSSGYYLDFNIVSQSKDIAGETVYHRYRANMWVAEKDIETWRNQIEPGAIVKFVGQWSAEQKEETKFPINVLKLDTKKVFILKTPVWLQKT